MARPRVSLTVIVRDEEDNLPACLGPLAGVFDEVVVVDTGSTDGTREVAARLGARVFEFPWADSFAAARNAALDRAAGGWAFRLDADDRLDPAEVTKLRALLGSLGDRPDGFAVRYTHDVGGTPVTLDEVRLFPNRPDVRWRYRVHEQIAPAVRRAGGSVVPTGVSLRHTGYADPATVRRKLERNLRLLDLDRAELPSDPFPHFYAGWTRLDLGDHAGAEAALLDACRVAAGGFTLRARCWSLLARARLAAGRRDDALAACRAGRAVEPRDAELACLEGELLLRSGDAGGAAAAFREVLSGTLDEDAGPPSGGDCRARACRGLASALPPERAAERESLWREAVAREPGSGSAWLGLGELLCGQGRWAELDRVVASAEAARPGGPEGGVLRAWGSAARGDYRSARRELSRYCREHPAAPLPRVVLTRVLFLEGRDRGAAERSVAELLRLDPTNPEADRFRALLARWIAG